ncbi:DUF192 domain-containing protein [Hoeflea poritis]|uniref:DUF192 domain-containing protein n=1 Tax=Hoeflea poritis TaxID=2993659 RepID=A0ABT4VVK0_9HYPH|nr:DUF192 domain-containing protein [Hoeflea poritis]MDA4848740.1 DUF192 domain-containing protein [Hoeflea poritis]
MVRPRLLLALLILVFSAGVSSANDRLQVATDSGTYDYTVELALTNGERAVGLMHREWMAPDAGMLFRFDDVRPVSMWMRNTLIPLDMIFIRPDGTVATIHRNAEPLSEKIINSKEPVRFVLELNAGDVDRMGLKPGDEIRHPIIQGQ